LAILADGVKGSLNITTIALKLCFGYVLPMEIATLAGGCFWGMEELFRQLPGVISTDVGYSGGKTENPKYEQVCTGKTGHAEALQIEFDPTKTDYKQVLELFFKVHDPTYFNKQGNDIGSQYRSIIFYHSEEQRDEAKAVITRVNNSRFWERPVVTEVVPFEKFYPAEDYHQDYLQKNPNGYTCHYPRDYEF